MPRPYSRNLVVQGTNGIAEGWPHRIHIEGKSAAHEWEDMEKYYEEFDHPLWKTVGKEALIPIIKKDLITVIRDEPIKYDTLTKKNKNQEKKIEDINNKDIETLNKLIYY